MFLNIKDCLLDTVCVLSGIVQGSSGRSGGAVGELLIHKLPQLQDARFREKLIPAGLSAVKLDKLFQQL